MQHKEGQFSGDWFEQNREIISEIEEKTTKCLYEADEKEIQVEIRASTNRALNLERNSL